LPVRQRGQRGLLGHETTLIWWSGDAGSSKNCSSTKESRFVGVSVTVDAHVWCDRPSYLTSCRRASHPEAAEWNLSMLEPPPPSTHPHYHHTHTHHHLRQPLNISSLVCVLQCAGVRVVGDIAGIGRGLLSDLVCHHVRLGLRGRYTYLAPLRALQRRRDVDGGQRVRRHL